MREKDNIRWKQHISKCQIYAENLFNQRKDISGAAVTHTHTHTRPFFFKTLAFRILYKAICLLYQVGCIS